ncbi:MAG: enoyl-CoA hydratase [Rhodospirillales bacterium]|nr:enoyl-CoA hydratase [Rhodospirillales bacterium]
MTAQSDTKTETLKNEPILLREDADGIATLTLNRPEKFNALSTELIALLQEELDKLAEDKSIRVVIIAGAGKAFCAGHDIKEMMDDPGPDKMQAIFDQCSRLMMSLTKLPQPVIARVHGIATAAGCQLVAQCDLAVAASDVKFATSGINYGLYCGTPSVPVTRNLPRKQAMEMLLTGEFIDAETAKNYGLINRIADPEKLDDAVLELAKSVAAQGPAFIAAGKKLFYSQIENGLAGAYEEATKMMVENMQRDDAQQGLNAFIEKRGTPDWEDR